jgi:ADP-ribose pyrophosphatase YjhB (NUDIX family)
VASKNPLTYEEFKAIYSKVPRLCVDLIIMTEKGVLLTLRTKDGYKNQWHFPGGTVFYRESIADAVHRVALKEVGVDVEIVKYLGHIEYFSEVAERGFGYTVTLAYLCHPLSDQIALDDHAEKWDFFKKLPQNTIIEQKRFLASLGAEFETD